MGLPASEQLVLDRIDCELRNADPQLASAFAAFTSVTRKTGLPATEQLGSRRSPAAIPGGRRTEKAGGLPFVLRLTLLFVIGALLAVAMVAAFSAVRQARCTVPAWSRAASARTWGVQPGPTSHGCGAVSPKKTQPSRH